MDNGPLSGLKCTFDQTHFAQGGLYVQLQSNSPWGNFGLSAWLKGTIASCYQLR